jgi:hypothetical protein
LLLLRLAHSLSLSAREDEGGNEGRREKFLVCFPDDVFSSSTSIWSLGGASVGGGDGGASPPINAPFHVRTVAPERRRRRRRPWRRRPGRRTKLPWTRTETKRDLRKCGRLLKRTAVPGKGQTRCGRRPVLCFPSLRELMAAAAVDVEAAEAAAAAICQPAAASDGRQVSLKQEKRERKDGGEFPKKPPVVVEERGISPLQDWRQTSIVVSRGAISLTISSRHRLGRGSETLASRRRSPTAEAAAAVSLSRREAALFPIGKGSAQVLSCPQEEEEEKIPVIERGENVSPFLSPGAAAAGATGAAECGRGDDSRVAARGESALSQHEIRSPPSLSPARVPRSFLRWS